LARRKSLQSLVSEERVFINTSNDLQALRDTKFPSGFPFGCLEEIKYFFECLKTQNVITFCELISFKLFRYLFELKLHKLFLHVTIPSPQAGTPRRSVQLTPAQLNRALKSAILFLLTAISLPFSILIWSSP
jgi:hypothetical protein